ncbi:hypothetical protein ACFW1M_35770 [Streptomyces inhibens]|uniref:hypothetical protein n=1 Tax=Streptomyces inhibens TaxID=2293571 RepID=UPI003675E2C0
MATRTHDFSKVQDTLFRYIREIRYARMVTVDRRNRPRARVLLPVWEIVDGRPVGWLAAYRTPVKTAHLAHNPHTTYAYWCPRQNALFVGSLSAWAKDKESQRHTPRGRSVTAPGTRQGPYRDTPHRPGASTHRPAPKVDMAKPRHSGQFSHESDPSPRQHPPILPVLTGEGTRIDPFPE